MKEKYAWLEQDMDVLISSGVWDNPWIGKLKDMRHDEILVAFYYMPHETAIWDKIKRNIITYRQELYSSNHLQWLSVDSVIDQCQVFDGLMEYMVRIASTCFNRFVGMNSPSRV